MYQNILQPNFLNITTSNNTVCIYSIIALLKTLSSIDFLLPLTSVVPGKTPPVMWYLALVESWVTYPQNRGDNDVGISNEVTLLLYCSQIISSHRLNSCTVPANKVAAAAPVRTPSGRLRAALPPELDFCLMHVAACRLWREISSRT